MTETPGAGFEDQDQTPTYESGFDEFDYQLAEETLRDYVKILESDIEAELQKEKPTTLEQFLRIVAKKISQLFPFNNEGIGISLVVEQIKQVGLALLDANFSYNWVNPEKSFDCKLPAVVTAAYLEDYFKKNNMPLVVRCTLFRNSTHALVAIENDSDPKQIVTVDYPPLIGGKIQRVYHFSPEAIQRFGPEYAATLFEGLQMFDQRYLWAVNNKGKNPEDSSE
jgi:hypothetical protein